MPRHWRGPRDNGWVLVMAGWQVINLGDALMAATDLADLQERFAHAYRQRGCPADMALYVRHVSDGRLHCEVLVYFSPAAAAVAEAAGAVPCAPPAAAGLGLLAGGP